MNNKEFIAELSRRTGYRSTDTQAMVRHLIDAMSEKMERILVNPGTRQRMLVPPKLVLGFKPNTAWKEKVKSTSRNVSIRRKEERPNGEA